jgi:hypothetical protein
VAGETPTERQIQRAILQMAGTCFRDVFITAIPNGAHLAGNDVARFKQMGALKGDGLKVGFPDLFCLWFPGKGALIEVKRPKTGKLSESQIEVHTKLLALMWPVTTVTSATEAYQFLLECGAPCSARMAA